MPTHNRENQLSKTVTGSSIYFVVTEAIPVFVEFHKDVSLAPKYNAKLWFTFITFSDFINSLASF